MDLATRKMAYYALLGLLMAGSTVAAFQVAPQVLPVGFLAKDGTISVYFNSIPSDISSNQGMTNSPPQPIIQPTNAHIQGTPFIIVTLKVTIDSVMIHKSGTNDSGWTSVSHGSVTIDLLKPSSVSVLIASDKIPAENVTMIELHVSNATATVKDPAGITSIKTVLVPGDSLRIPLTSGLSVNAQMSTSIIADRPHIVTDGSGQIRLTPVLNVDSISGPR